MRIWDLPPSELCRNHLLGEHRELHALWNILTEDKDGYSRHPETCRWRGKRSALYKRHKELVEEMKRRDYNHDSPLDTSKATGESEQSDFVDLPEKQKQILKQKDCKCYRTENDPE